MFRKDTSERLKHGCDGLHSADPATSIGSEKRPETFFFWELP